MTQPTDVQSESNADHEWKSSSGARRLLQATGKESIPESESADQEWKSSSGARRLLQATGKQSIPEGALLMSRNEVGTLIHRIINNWKPRKEV